MATLLLKMSLASDINMCVFLLVEKNETNIYLQQPLFFAHKAKNEKNKMLGKNAILTLMDHFDRHQLLKEKVIIPEKINHRKGFLFLSSSSNLPNPPPYFEVFVRKHKGSS